ncbi:hypothetical protein P7C73_g1180, partial [Tremellales sp. Uapishka_1]
MSSSPPAAAASESARWSFFKRPNSHGNNVSFMSQASSEDDPLLPVSTTKRKPRLRREYAIYAALILGGICLGWSFSKIHFVRKGEIGDGPMVPGSFKLPPPTGLPRNRAYLTEATSAAVASEDVTCSNLGLAIMRDHNGTAVDAAVTTTLCIGLLNAFSSGIGGGGFMVVRVPDPQGGQSNITAIDFRETSPQETEKEMYGTKKAGRVGAQVGGLAVGVPGELRGLEEGMWMRIRRWGGFGVDVDAKHSSPPLWKLAMETSRHARGGAFERVAGVAGTGQEDTHLWVNPSTDQPLPASNVCNSGFMSADTTWASIYAPRGALLVEGDWIQRINYGKTLEAIAHRGVEAFYEGEIAENMVETVASRGGILSLKDLKSYRARSYPAIHSTYHGKTIYTTDAPSSGGVMLGMMNILEPYNITELNPLNTHRLIEAMKFAFGARSEITDPKFATLAQGLRFEEFYQKSWADGKRALMTDNTTHEIGYYDVKYDTPVDGGTTHLNTVDQWGGAAAVTSTVNLIWGSHVMCPKTGVIFNDEQDDFAVPGAADAFGLLPSPWNYPAPNKRPLSSTAASILEYPNGTLYAVLGGSGGSRIFGAIAQVLINLESGMNLSEAIEAPRIHNQIIPATTTLEVGPEGMDEVLVKSLRKKGHDVVPFDINLGIAEVQAIMLQDGKVWASSDSRKNGVAAGY